jgi:hypothetical protein
MSLFGCDRPVLDAARDDEKLTFFQPDLPVTEIHPKPPFHYQEKLILILMMMPDEFSLEFDQFDVLAIELAGDPWVPMVVDLAELFLDVYFLHLHPFLIHAHVV